MIRDSSCLPCFGKTAATPTSSESSINDHDILVGDNSSTTDSEESGGHTLAKSNAKPKDSAKKMFSRSTLKSERTTTIPRRTRTAERQRNNYSDNRDRNLSTGEMDSSIQVSTEISETRNDREHEHDDDHDNVSLLGQQTRRQAENESNAPASTTLSLPPPRLPRTVNPAALIRTITETLKEKSIDLTATHQKIIEDALRGNSFWAQELFQVLQDIQEKEQRDLSQSKLKWPKNFLAGSVVQWSSFSAAMELAIYFQNPWLFLLAAVFSEAFSEKAAALIRDTTYITKDNKKLLRKQRLIARATGDAIRQCFGLPPMKKYTTDDPAFKTKRLTAAEALAKDKDYFAGITNYNFLNRGAPFLAFTGTYIGRDFLLASGMLGTLSAWQMVGVRLTAGAIAGGLTSLLNQFFMSMNKDAEEKFTHSTHYWRHRENYLITIRDQAKMLFNQIPNTNLNAADEARIKQAFLDFDDKLYKEIELVRLRKSKLTAFSAEVKQSLEKKRDLSSIDPENPGSRAESLFSLLGKLISLVYFTYMLNSQTRGDNNFPGSYAMLGIILMPVFLIMAGFALKDDLRLIPRMMAASGKALGDSLLWRDAYHDKLAAATPHRGADGVRVEEVEDNSEIIEGSSSDSDEDMRPERTPVTKVAATTTTTTTTTSTVRMSSLLNDDSSSSDKV